MTTPGDPTETARPDDRAPLERAPVPAIDPTAVSRDDIEAKMREITGEVTGEVKGVEKGLIAAGVGVAVVVLVVAFALGRRRGRKRTTIVEVRRL